MKANALGRDLSLLSSPVTGGAITVPRLHQLFLLSIVEGNSRPEEWARDVWTLLSGQGQKVLKDGKPLETPEENLADLVAKAHEFEATRHAVYRALRLF